MATDFRQMDQRQLNDIVMPDLQDMAINPQLLDQLREQRFDSDEPPPYRSPSPESEYEYPDGRTPGMAASMTAQEFAEIKERVTQPLSEDERGPFPPRRNLSADAGQGAAESFITSRPWYTFAMDLEVERTRLERIPRAEQRHFNMSHTDPVEKRWRENGTWDPYKKGPFTLPGWKWGHESPSPEPEDLRNIEFSPSEIDALEAIPPPTPSPPKFPPRKWRIVPGTEHRLIPKFEEVLSPEPETSIPEAMAVEREEAAQEAAADAMSPPQPKPTRRRLPRKAKQTADRTPEPLGNPGPRRSARIAARDAEQAPHIEVVAVQTGPKPENLRATSAGEAGSDPRTPRRERPRARNNAAPKASKPQGIVKEKARRRKK